ncbi:MAG: murein L,D-transpeptidase catalytic domain family protein, partial [Chitinophagaceae bacterium]
VLTIVDFSLPSNEKRLFVIDVEEEKVLFNTYVAHGRGSGEKMAQRFSNVPESFQSSLGFYSTSSTYQGKHGYSLRLSGLEPGFNNLAEERAIVIHSADYVSEGFIRTKGYLGRSWGCPALPEKLNKPIIDEIKNGSCLFIYSPNNNYLKKSKLLNA